MLTLADMTRTGLGASKSPIFKPIAVDRGMLVTLNLNKTKLFLEKFFGFRTVKVNDSLLLARHASDRSNGNAYWILSIREVVQIDKPQNMYNHWGFGIPGNEEVDKAYHAAVQHKDEYGIRRIQKPAINHGSYSFYLEDISTNWWEVESRPEANSYANGLNGTKEYVSEEIVR
ncbi:VOC family protein [Roseiarcaceae bacterium H3SJ34-1]|uniref:VOC family protein n=1 Tax=Terripilifer ovatus TaxID=3032367 RepID=UPI003AB9641E|nr:VOC family protein [Roseiarcaceae bacterium H3SJ34-1]